MKAARTFCDFSTLWKHARLAIFCLSGCFRLRPAVVSGSAASVLSCDSSPVSAEFATEEVCQEYLARCRWPEGYVCPRCGHRRGYPLVGQRRWECAACGHQVSLTSGTVLHNTKTPLILWLWTAYLMTTDKRGVSALPLQRQLGLRRYETAWMMLHKLRRAMVNAAREPLHGEVEVDETWVGGTQAGDPRQPSAQGAWGGARAGRRREAGKSHGAPPHGRHP